MTHSLSSVLSAAEEEEEEKCAFMMQMFDSIFDNHFHTFYALLLKYSSKFKIGIDEIVLQLTNGSKNNVLHYACQCAWFYNPTIGTTKESTTTTTTTTATTTITYDINHNKYDSYIHNNDIVSRMLFFDQYNNEDLFMMIDTTSQEEQDSLQQLSLPWLTSDTLNQLIRCKDKDGLTPLMFACQCPIPALCESRIFALLKFVAETASSSISTASSSTPSASSTKTKKNTNTKLTLSRSKIGATALHYLAANHSGIVSRTIEALYDDAPIALRTNTGYEDGGTPLHWACSNVGWKDAPNSMRPISSTFHIETIQTLIRLCKNHVPEYDIINQSDHTISPALLTCISTMHYMKTTMHLTNTKCFLESCIDYQLNIIPTLEYIVYPNKVNILHMIVKQGMAYILVMILSYLRKVDVSVLDKLLSHQDSNAKIPLEIAAREKHMECISILLHHEDQKKKQKTTPTTSISSNEDNFDPSQYMFYESLAMQYIDQYHQNNISYKNKDSDSIHTG